MTPVRASYLADGESILDTKVPGALKYWAAASGYVGGFSFRCPCCGEHWGSVRFQRPGVPGGWQWDKNLQRPTVNPSIALSIGDGQGGAAEHWHGHLVAGEWRQC